MKDNRKMIAALSASLILIVAIVSLGGCDIPGVSMDGNLTAKVTSVKSTSGSAEYLVDGKRETKWSADASDGRQYAELVFSEDVTFDTIVIDESGYSVSGFEIYMPKEENVLDGWVQIYKGTVLGKTNGEMAKISLPEPITANALKIVITKSDGRFSLREIGIYLTE